MAEIYRQSWQLLSNIDPLALSERQSLHGEGVPEGMKRWSSLMCGRSDADLLE
jgi:hypothetical protein